MVARLLEHAILVYQRSLSRLLGPRCRFYPSCSEYSRLCLKKYPLFQAGFKTITRLSKCHPFHPGGIDYP